MSLHTTPEMDPKSLAELINLVGPAQAAEFMAALSAKGGVTLAPQADPKLKELLPAARKERSKRLDHDTFECAWKRHLGPFWSELTVSQCVRAKAKEYRELRASQIGHYSKRKIRPATRNKEMRYVKFVLDLAVEDKIIREHWLTDLAWETEDDDPKFSRDFYLTVEEFTRLWDCARIELRLMLAIWGCTGMRRIEVLGLRKSELFIQGGQRHIKLHPSRVKNRKRPPEFPLADMALEAVRLAVDLSGSSQWLFPSPHAIDGHWSKSAVQDWFEKARVRARIKGPEGQDCWIHTLRHTWASWMSMTAGMPTEMLMKYGRWSERKTAERYINMGRDQHAKVIDLVNSAMPRLSLSSRHAAKAVTHDDLHDATDDDISRTK